MRSLSTAALVLAAISVAVAPRANAAVVGTGQLTAVDFDGSPPTFTFDGTFTWDDLDADVLGTLVNLGATFPGEQAIANGVVTGLNFGDFSADFVVDLLSDAPAGSVLDLTDVTGSAVCTEPTCLNATATFLGTASTVSATPGLLPAEPLVYFVDGSLSLDVALNGSGPFGLNAFVPQDTPVGAPVTVASGEDIFYNSVTDSFEFFSAEVTFTEVLAAGSTVFVPLSAAEGTIPANIELSPSDGIESHFIDVRTTASYTGPVEVCIEVLDAGPSSLARLRILHREGPGPASPGGAFVDVTTSVTAPQRVCGIVDGLSPIVAGLDTGEPTTTTTTPSTTTSTTSSSTVTTTSVPSTSTSTTVNTTSTTATTTSTTFTTTTTPTTVPSSSTTSITTSTLASTTTTVAPTTTTSTIVATTSTTSTSTTTSTTTTLSPVCDDVPTFESTLCRADELIALVEASDIPEPTKGNLLRGLTAAREATAAAEERVDAGSTRGGKSRLKSAKRRMTSVLFRLRSLRGSRVISEPLRGQLADLAARIREDITTLRNSL